MVHRRDDGLRLRAEHRAPSDGRPGRPRTDGHAKRRRLHRHLSRQLSSGRLGHLGPQVRAARPAGLLRPDERDRRTRSGPARGRPPDRRDRLDRLERTDLLLRTRTHNASLSTDRRETLPRFRTAYRPLVGRAEPTGTGGPPPDSGGYRRNGTVEDERGAESLRNDVLFRGTVRTVPRHRRAALSGSRAAAGRRARPRRDHDRRVGLGSRNLVSRRRASERAALSGHGDLRHGNVDETDVSNAAPHRRQPLRRPARAYTTRCSGPCRPAASGGPITAA